MRASVLARPVRPVSTHRPRADPSTPGVCWCALPLTLLNARHQVDEQALAVEREQADELQRVERARYGDSD